MDEEPKRRRWFQFRLSTGLILIAIAAWVMATRPHAGIRFWRETGVISSQDAIGHLPDGSRDEPGYWTILVSSSTTTHYELIIYIGPDPQLAWPLLALAAFLGWKAALAIRQRHNRRRGCASPE